MMFGFKFNVIAILVPIIFAGTTLVSAQEVLPLEIQSASSALLKDGYSDLTVKKQLFGQFKIVAHKYNQEIQLSLSKSGKVSAISVYEDKNNDGIFNWFETAPESTKLNVIEDLSSALPENTVDVDSLSGAAETNSDNDSDEAVQAEAPTGKL